MLLALIYSLKILVNVFCPVLFQLLNSFHKCEWTFNIKILHNWCQFRVAEGE